MLVSLLLKWDSISASDASAKVLRPSHEDTGTEASISNSARSDDQNLSARPSHWRRQSPKQVDLPLLGWHR